MDIQVLEKVITGRVEPHIYAFETCSVPNFLKIGDTYRPVYQRLEEWKRHYRNLQKRYDQPAVIEDKYFRDYSVHEYVEGKGRTRITDADFAEGLYHSREFFRDAIPADIDEAIADINRSYRENTGDYPLYSMENIPGREETVYVRNTALTQLRDNQSEVVRSFTKAIDKGRTKLLMYAVMRFGKSITAMSCAEVMPNCKLVVIVSAKADVKDSWESTIKTIKNFEDFDYANGDSLKENPELISQYQRNGKKLAICLTLQDISTDEIKERYNELFNGSVIDLLIVDETHFGARAEHFGRVLQSDPEAKKETDSDDKDETFDNLDKTVHALKNRVQLHLSGTPYRILLGNEFSEEDIICQCTYPDIIAASKAWDEKYLDTKEEWENPYYGFPQMVRFAFNFNASALKKLELLRKQGKEFIFDALFETQKNAEGNYVFVNETEVTDFLKAINSGDRDTNILSFLNNQRIRDGKLCHHIVMVLPRRAACDAMENLIKEHGDLQPLADYTIVNAAGKLNQIKKQSKIKQIIRNCENEGKRTLTLTVNRMLTGTTVPEWDTMIFLKGTSSPQEYDQAIYRLQNPFIKEYKSEEGEVIKYNMKPQTLLVDFSPERMFVLQEQRAFYSTVNSHEYGNDKIEKEIKRELDISPILYLNHDRLQEVTAVDVLDKIRKYSSNRSIMDEAREVGTDYTLKDNDELYAEIMRYTPIGTANIMTTKAYDSEEESDAEVPDDNGKESSETQQKDKEGTKKNDEDNYEKRLATYFSHILFFAYLTKNRVKTLSDICSVSAEEENQRIANHLGLNLPILGKLAQGMNPTRREMLEFKIANINDLSHDDNILPEEKVENAMKQFGRWSEYEIITPANIADDMMALIPEEEVGENFRFLDIASKEGEFANAIYKRFKDKVKNNIYSLPTSGVAYEFTRKVYEELGLPVENIISEFNTYDLIGTNKEQYKEFIKNMKINAIVGNPPYHNAHSKDKDAVNRAFSSAVYPQFMDAADYMTLSYVSMITPSRWMTKTGQGVSDNWVDEMLNCNHFISVYDFYNALDCFGNNIELKGGVNYFLYDKHYTGICNLTLQQNGQKKLRVDYLNSLDSGVVIRDLKAYEILKKITVLEGQYFLTGSFSKLVGPVHWFDKNGVLGTKWTDFSLTESSEYSVKYYLNQKVETSGFAWIKESDIPKGKESLGLHKIYISEAYNGGDSFPHKIIGKPFYGEPNSVCSETYLCIGYTQQDHKFSKQECENIISYINTKFFRYLVSIKKKTQHAPAAVYQFVPLQDFSEPWTDEKLYKKYNLSTEEIAYIESLIKPME